MASLGLAITYQDIRRARWSALTDYAIGMKYGIRKTPPARTNRPFRLSTLLARPSAVASLVCVAGAPQACRSLLPYSLSCYLSAFLRLPAVLLRILDIGCQCHAVWAFRTEYTVLGACALLARVLDGTPYITVDHYWKLVFQYLSIVPNLLTKRSGRSLAKAGGFRPREWLRF